MFRRIASTLPQDLTFPADLAQLGYFLNDRDQIRQIRNPELKYQSRVNANERVNDMYRDAMNTCVTGVVKQRLKDIGFETLRIPLEAGPTDRHVPIYVSSGITTKKRVILLFPERQIDPTIFSFRVIGDEGISEGSVINFVTSVINGPTATSDDEPPGVILTNPSQLFWHRGGQKAVTWHDWLNIPRPSTVHPPYRVDNGKNLIPGNADSKEHVQYIFEQVLLNVTRKDAKVDIIGLEWTGKEALEYLSAHWSEWSHRVSSVCLTNPQHKVEDLISQYDASTEFLDFLRKKCRAYFIGPKQSGTVVQGRQEFGCNCFASGEELYPDQIVIRTWGSMLDHFNAVHSLPNYEEAERFAPEDLDEEPTSNP